MFSRTSTIALLAGLAIAGSAAADSLSVNLAGVSSVSAATSRSFENSSLLRADAVRISGQLEQINPLTRPDEALIILKDWFTTTPELVIQPFRSSATFRNTLVEIPPVSGNTPILRLVPIATVSDLIIPIKQGELVQNDVTVRFDEIIDTAGDDAKWRSLKIEFISRPGAVSVGLITPGRQTLPAFNLAAGETRFFDFRVAPDTSPNTPIMLDIDTEGSGADVSLALFDSRGNLVASDLDDGVGGNAQLTFGGPRSPGLTINDARPYDGRDGAIREGHYLIGVTAARGGFRSGWTVPGGAAAASGVRVNFTVNTGALPFSRVDADRNGVVNASDINRFTDDFLAAQ